jgi:hemoglobin-like flavoprotein
LPQTPDRAQVLNDSLERLAGNPTFFTRFYELFLDSSDEVREKFKDTDLERQIRTLKASFYHILLAARGDSAAHDQLEPIARRHSRFQLNVRPELYRQWLDCLLRAVEECDPRFKPEVEQAWRDTMEWGIRFMMSRY